MRELDMQNNRGNYVTLSEYCNVFPLNKFEKISNVENYNCGKKHKKEKYGAFSISAAVRLPWNCNPREYTIPGVN
jgi:hypothetical protein